MRRKFGDWIARGATVICTLIAIVPLVLIIGYVLVVGGRSLSVDFFTQVYQPPLTIDVSAPADGVIAPAPDVIVPVATSSNDAAAPIEGTPTNESIGAAATADPFANIDVGALAGAIPDSANGAATPAAGAPTADPFANIDVGALAGADAAPPVSEAAPPSSVVPTTAASPDQIATAEVIARGGVLHGIVGTLLVTGVALLFAVPIGLLAGIFLAEYPKNRLATIVRFCTDVLSGAPSIIAGVVAYILLVQRFQSFSGLAGSIALTILMVPTITRHHRGDAEACAEQSA